MTTVCFGQIAPPAGGNKPYGEDVSAGGWEDITIDRIDGPPLSFIGCRISLHWRQLDAGRLITICLWRRQKSGFVVGFTNWSQGNLRNVGVSVDSLAEAMTFLEDFCTDQSAIPVTVQLRESLWQIQQFLAFTTAFAFLVGEALSAWTAPVLATRIIKTKYRVKA